MVAKAPKAPDPVATAQAQSQMNRETAITQYNLNATDQRTPYGDLTYKQVGKWEDGTPRYEATQTLSPQLEAISKNLLGSADALSGNLINTVGKPFDPSNLPAHGAALTGGVGMETSLQQKGVSLPQVPVEASWSGPQARYNIDNAGPIQKSIGADDWSVDRNRVEEAMFSRLNPSLERDRASLDAKLRAQGITQGSEAYRNAADELNRSATDARLQTILAGGQEQSRLAGLELQQGNFRNSAQAQQYGQNANDASFFNSAQNQNFGQSMAMDQFAREGRMANNDIMLQDVGFNNNAALQQASFRNQAQNQGFNQQLAAEQYNNGNRQQALQEAAFFRSLPLNDINALLSGTQIAGPQFTNTPTPGVAGVDYTGLVSQNYQAQVQAANQKNANLFGGLASIGSGIFGAAGAAKGFGNLFSSDRRLKRDIHPMPAKLGGFQLYSYRYLGCDALSFGVMADEVEAVMPEAVINLNGFKAVYYDMLEAA